MSDASSPRSLDGIQPVLITDFDGTMTRFDFYKLVIEQLLPAETPNFWAEYRSGAITHFEALRRYFAEIRSSEDEVQAVMRQMGLDPDLPQAVKTLHQAGWEVIVTSAGCDWYIRQLLETAGVAIPIFSNPGRFLPGAGLLMQRPSGSPYLSESLGIDKTAVVRHYVAQGGVVAFAGDGFPDADPARLVPAQRRFARGDLADVLRRDGLDFQPFETWSEIPRMLLQVTTSATG